MPNIAIVGATGAVGTEFLTLFTERGFPVDELRLLATARSAGKRIEWREGFKNTREKTAGATDRTREIEVRETTEASFAGMDFVFFAGGSASTAFVPAAVKSGAIVIDNSSAFRMDPEVPLVIPEVNPEDIRWHKGVIANPNCSTIIMAMALKPVEDAARVERVVVSTYQAVSGAGNEGLCELESQVKAWAREEDFKRVHADSRQVFTYPIAFNVIPHIDRFCDDGSTNEELKMVRETRKIFHRQDMRIAATTVRVPVWRSHSEAINVETKAKLSPEAARSAMRGFPGLAVMDVPAENCYPTPLAAAGLDEVFVGRIREDVSVERGLSFWVAGDQIRKGAALNAVQIAELFL